MAEPLIQDVFIPKPIQVVIDDVGWWSGHDGHEQGEPFRTGIQRNHVPADYEAIAQLGESLGMRPQAALVLCEWDRGNILRRLPSATWMGAAWDNARWNGPWLDEAAAIFRDKADCIEPVLHGVGHEYWDDGRMGRAEWHDTEGRMRPERDVRRHLDAFGELMAQNGLGAFPESCVPAAFLHRYANGDGGLARVLASYGVRYLSTPFQSMHSTLPLTEAQKVQPFLWDGDVFTAARGTDLCRWCDIAPHPGGELTGTVCGMHWPNLLHPDPARNREVVQRWVDFLRPYGTRLETMLAGNTRAFCGQLVYHVEGTVQRTADEVFIDLTGVASGDVLGLAAGFSVRVRTTGPAAFASKDFSLRSVRVVLDVGQPLYEIEVLPGEARRGSIAVERDR